MGVDLDDTLERAAHKALTEFYEHQRLRLEESDHQVSAKDRLIERVQKGNRDLLQENHRLEVRLKQANDELMRTYRSRDFKTDLLDDARTRLQHAQDELTAAQSYVHHLETELHERDDQLEASQAQVQELADAVHHLHELLPQDEEPEEPEEPEEDPEEVQGMSGVEDN